MSQDAPISDRDDQDGPGATGKKKRSPLVIWGAGLALLSGSLGAIYYGFRVAEGDVAEEAWEATDELLTEMARNQEKKAADERLLALQTVSGRYIPAQMNPKGEIVALGHCAHIYIKIDQQRIEKNSGGSQPVKEAFKSFQRIEGTMAEQNHLRHARYAFIGKTEGKIDPGINRGSRPAFSVPRWRQSQYEIAYFEDREQPYLTISQIDRFTLVGGGNKTSSSHAYYLPCP